jgi:hypothetical protein
MVAGFELGIWDGNLDSWVKEVLFDAGGGGNPKGVRLRAGQGFDEKFDGLTSSGIARTVHEVVFGLCNM